MWKVLSCYDVIMGMVNIQSPSSLRLQSMSCRFRIMLANSNANLLWNACVHLRNVPQVRYFTLVKGAQQMRDSVTWRRLWLAEPYQEWYLQTDHEISAHLPSHVNVSPTILCCHSKMAVWRATEWQDTKECYRAYDVWLIFECDVEQGWSAYALKVEHSSDFEHVKDTQ